MEYTYSAYSELINSLKLNGYSPIRFCDVSEKIVSPAIIRHDVDLDLKKALEIAQLENDLGVKSTYFVLISSEYYNLLAGENLRSVFRILELGHEIGLHFDISAYDKDISLEEVMCKELKLLESIIGTKVQSVSWHI